LFSVVQVEPAPGLVFVFYWNPGALSDTRDDSSKGVFSCPKSAAAESLCSNVLHCSILFLFGENCSNID
jgi:hypothetical protein